MKGKWEPAANRIQQINEAIIVANRFIESAIRCREALQTDQNKAWSGCKEQAAMKRASMDLTRALPCLRRGA